MAVYLECINLIIPIPKIENAENIDGFAGFIALHKSLIGEMEWYDDYLYRTGAMNPLDIDDLVEEFHRYGLVATIEKNGVRTWNDMCLIDSAAGLTRPCSWIEYDLDERCAWLKGTQKGDIKGPYKR